MLVGGPSNAQEADATVQEICDVVRESVEAEIGRQLGVYTAVLVSRQVVAGTNYFVKVHVGEEEYIHIRVFQPLPGQGGPSLHSCQHGKTKEDQLSYF